ncbi:MAG: hypothetical protein M3O23_00680 [Actinomycetota bacterium]|nr:hypothetical protein [Actinomycetota bacterium]
MASTVAEHQIRSRRFGPRQRVRVDLHGVSVFGPGSRRTLIRWEWMEAITVDGGVVVRSTAEQLTLPPGAFGLAPEALAAQLERARSIVHRPDVIGSLSGS